MDYLQNHIWCSDSCWGGMYDCRHLVSITSYQDDKDDWSEIVDEQAERFFDEEGYYSFLRFYQKRYPEEAKNINKDDYFIDVQNLKPHVLKWLDENVKDRKDPECEKGWCIGSSGYRKVDTGSITVFFHRRNDALAFVRKFSKYKKPVHYCQYFTDDRKKLNLETLKYEKV